MKIAAIPTIYKNVRFRSRLEAKWAAFFDLVGWRWEYEPLDFDGWIPDFALYGETGNVILVEVKPILSFDEGLANRTRDEIDKNYPYSDENETFTPTIPVFIVGHWVKNMVVILLGMLGMIIGVKRLSVKKYDTGRSGLLSYA